MSDQPTPAPLPLVVRMAVRLRHDAGTVTIVTPVIQPTDEADARERAITMVCAAERAPRRAVLSVGREGEPATPMGAWVIGHNLTGYLPESDTFAHAEWQEAYDALMDHAREYADADDEATEDVDCGHGPDDEDMAEHLADCYGTMRATVDSIAADPSFGPGHDAGRDYSFWIVDGRDRSISFWLMWSPDRTPYDEDDQP